MPSKVCRICDTELPLDQFNKDAKRKDGHDTRCKECFKVYIKTYRELNKEKLKGHAKEYRVAHQVERNEWRRKYSSKNIAKGACKTCGKDSWPFTSCLAHRASRISTRKKRRLRYIREGECPRCGIVLHIEMDKGSIDCATCRQRRSIG